MPPRGAFTVAAVEVVGPQFLIGHAVAEHIEGNFQDLMADGDDRFVVPAMALHAVVAGLQRGPFGARHGLPGLDQRAAQIAVAIAEFAGAPFAGALVLARADRGPAAQM